MDQYDLYQDCYKSNFLTNTMRLYSRALPYLQTIPDGKQTADFINNDSTDNHEGYPCFMDSALTNYMNRDELMKAIHVDQAWINSVSTWLECNQPLYDHYPVTYWDTTSVFEDIFANVSSEISILIYNGDVDTVCNFMGNEWLMRDIANNNQFTVGERVPWFFRNQVAGYARRYSRAASQGKSAITLDVLTVKIINLKGAGHFVPTDRPGPALQMMANFLLKQSNYSSTAGIDVTPTAAPGKLSKANSDTFNVALLTMIIALFAIY
uniref:Serine carboxypeptidase n=1 Tax=Ascaris lumbricoides TaxID=6252 RepID=A0A0M3I5L7_ASCLU